MSIEYQLSVDQGSIEGPSSIPIYDINQHSTADAFSTHDP